MPEPLRLALPIPPSVNAAYKNVLHVGRAKTKVLKNWYASAGWRVRLQLPDKSCRNPIFTKPVKVYVELEPCRGDLDNRAKALLDLMTTLNVWTNDDLVYDLHLRWANVEGCQVTISEIEA